METFGTFCLVALLLGGLGYFIYTRVVASKASKGTGGSGGGRVTDPIRRTNIK